MARQSLTSRFFLLVEPSHLDHVEYGRRNAHIEQFLFCPACIKHGIYPRRSDLIVDIKQLEELVSWLATEEHDHAILEPMFISQDVCDYFIDMHLEPTIVRL